MLILFHILQQCILNFPPQTKYPDVNELDNLIIIADTTTSKPYPSYSILFVKLALL